MKLISRLIATVLIIFSLVFVESGTLAVGGLPGKAKSVSRRKAKATVSDRDGQLEAAEERARLAEERAQRAEETASKAHSEAKAAQEQAAQASEAVRRANETLSQMQQTLSRLESSLNQEAKETTEKNAGELRPAKKLEDNVKQGEVQAKQVEGAVTTNSKLPVKLYGSVLVNSNFVDKGTNNIDVPLFAQKAGTAADQNHQNFNMTARQSRFGLRYEGKIFKDAKLTGAFEFDLFGGKPAFANGAHFDLFRLRLAYARIDWQKDSLEVGQDWAVFSPLNPTTLASYAIPGFAASGNLWYRMPQIRYEHREKIGEKSNVVFTTALLDPNAGDNAGNPAFRTVGLGERGALPAFEGRIGFNTQAHERESSFGVSGHYSRWLAEPGGTSGVTVRSPIDSYGVSFDANIWLSSAVRVTGELFHGRALSTFSGNIAQLVNVINGRAVGINSTGGWFEVHAEAPKHYDGKWKNFSANFGYGTEENRDRDLSVGQRDRNQTYMGNGQYKFSPNFTLALEYRRIQTGWFRQPSVKQGVNWANMAFLFSF